MGGNGTGLRLADVGDAVPLADMLGAVGELGHGRPLEAGEQPVVGVAHALPAKIEAELRVKGEVHAVAVIPSRCLLRPQVPFVHPFLQRLMPVAEMHDRQPVIGLVTQDGQHSFAIGHDLPFPAARGLRPLCARSTKTLQARG